MGAGGKSARRLRHSAAAPGASRQCASLRGAARASRTRHTPHAASATRAQLDSEKIKSGEFSARSSCQHKCVGSKRGTCARSRRRRRDGASAAGCARGPDARVMRRRTVTHLWPLHYATAEVR